jgi:hypothetical protein
MPPADVEDLTSWVHGIGVSVRPAEEGWRLGIGGKVLDPISAQLAQALAGQRVDAVIGDVLRGLAHLHQARSRLLQVFPFGYQQRIITHVASQSIRLRLPSSSGRGRPYDAHSALSNARPTAQPNIR